MIALRCKSQTKSLENSSMQNVANKITGKIIYTNHRDVKQSVCFLFWRNVVLFLFTQLCVVIDHQPGNRHRKKNLAQMLSFRSSMYNVWGIKSQIAFNSEF